MDTPASPAIRLETPEWTIFSALPFDDDDGHPDLRGRCIEGRFQLRERRGRGGMADVYVAKDIALRGLAAVKILREPDAEAQRRFASESEVLANLRHPHVVNVLAAGRTRDGLHYMALEYLPGEDLAVHLRRRGGIEVSRYPSSFPVLDGE